MTWKEERERLLQGLDPKANAVMAHLAAQGWAVDRILKNVAQKEYLPHRATVRVEFDREYQHYWVNGEYVSEGNNVLAGCFAFIKESFSPEQTKEALDAFLADAERSINQSFAVRFLGPAAVAGAAGAGTALQEAAVPGANEEATRELTLLSKIPNQTEIVAAGLPRERLVDLGRALEAFWGAYTLQFPEVSSGDSQMVDEPSNALAVWIAQTLGIDLARDGLSLPEICFSEVGCSSDRLEAAQAACIEAVCDALRPSIPGIGVPGTEVHGYLTTVLSDVLHWNFPREDDTDDEGTEEPETGGRSPSN